MTENDFLSLFEDALIDEEYSDYQLNLEMVARIKRSYDSICEIAYDSDPDAKITSDWNEAIKSIYTITVNCDWFGFAPIKKEKFLEIVRDCGSIEIVPKTDGTADIDFSFYNCLIPKST